MQLVFYYNFFFTSYFLKNKTIKDILPHKSSISIKILQYLYTNYFLDNNPWTIKAVFDQVLQCEFCLAYISLLYEA